MTSPAYPPNYFPVQKTDLQALLKAQISPSRVPYAYLPARDEPSEITFINPKNK